MKLALMQPYVFPYLGYYQLMNEVDIWIWYEDVNYIKGGYVNRNKLKNNISFTIPLEDASSFKKINQTMVSGKYDFWLKKMKTQLYHLYHKSPYYSLYIDEIHTIFAQRNISSMAISSGEFIAKVLQFNTVFRRSTEFNNDVLNGQARVLDFCLRFKAETYINPIGGLELYSEEEFKKSNTNLCFLRMKSGSPQDNLSILHLLLENGPEYIHEKLTNFELIKKNEQ